MKNTIIILILLLSSCTSNEKRFLGKQKTKGIENLYVKYYQEDKFDMTIPLSYEVVNENDSIIFNQSFLWGTHDKLVDCNYFYSGVYDSILYISYPNPEEICVIKNLKINSEENRDSLFKILKLHNNALIEQ